MSVSKVLVTGGAGFIGSHVVDRLVSEGLEVVVVDDLSTGRREYLNPKARFYQVDIRSLELEEVFQRERPQVVDHHAAQISVNVSVREPEKDAQVNILGSLNLLTLSARYGVQKVIYISSGGTIYGEPHYLPCDEKHPIEPIAPYAISKYSGELYLRMFKKVHDLPYTVLRYGNVYGPRQDPFGEAGVVAIFALKMLRREPVTINGSGEQERDFCYVGDVVEANLVALEKGEGGTYNIGTGAGTSVNEIAALLREETAYPLEPLHGPPVPGEVSKVYLDCRRALKELGWKAKTPLKEGLSRTVEYFRQTASS